jgi:4-hydroxy-tetrahydrodipicolinate synthase
MRAPSLRIPDRWMKALRQGLVASGCDVTPDPDSAFIAGRYPC